MYYGEVEAGVGYSLTRTLRDRDVEEEPTRTYLRRVLVSEYPTAAPPKVQMEYLWSSFTPAITRLLYSSTTTLIQPKKLSISTNRSSINRQYLLIGKSQQVMRSAGLGAGT